MYRQVILTLFCLLVVTQMLAQTEGRVVVVADLETRRPIRDVLVYLDNGDHVKLGWQGKFMLYHHKFKRATFSHPDYLRRVMDSQEFTVDTVFLIPLCQTLSEVIAGLMQVPNPPPIGYIPLGSANDVASTLGLPKDTVEAAKVIVKGMPHPFDVGSFGSDAYFTYVAAFGAFTEVSYATPQNEKAALGYMAYMLHAAGALSKLESIHTRIDYEGGTIEGDVLYGGVSNSTRVAGVVKLKKDLVSLSDGKFEVLLVPTPKSLGAFTRSASGLLGQKYDGVNVILIQSADLTVTFDKPVAWTRDGEDGGAHQVVHLVNHPSAVNIIV